MTLVSALIKDGFRESNLISITADPTSLEQGEALVLLNQYVQSIYGNGGAGEELQTMAIGRNNLSRPSGYPWYDQVPNVTDWYVPVNIRMALNLTSPLSVYLDPKPDDGQRFAFMDLSNNLATNPFTIIGNGQLIAGAISQVYNVNGMNMEFIYRKDLGTWLPINPLALTDTFPFPTEYEPMFSIALAMRLNPRNAVQMDPQSSATYTKLFRQFVAQYRQHVQVDSELGLRRLSGTRRQRYWDDTSYANASFRSGYGFPFGNR